jgi:hypothetical protein
MGQQGYGPGPGPGPAQGPGPGTMQMPQPTSSMYFEDGEMDGGSARQSRIVSQPAPLLDQCTSLVPTSPS